MKGQGMDVMVVGKMGSIGQQQCGDDKGIINLRNRDSSQGSQRYSSYNQQQQSKQQQNDDDYQQNQNGQQVDSEYDNKQQNSGQQRFNRRQTDDHQYTRHQIIDTDCPRQNSYRNHQQSNSRLYDPNLRLNRQDSEQFDYQASPQKKDKSSIEQILMKVDLEYQQNKAKMNQLHSFKKQTINTTESPNEKYKCSPKFGNKGVHDDDVLLEESFNEPVRVESISQIITPKSNQKQNSSGIKAKLDFDQYKMSFQQSYKKLQEMNDKIEKEDVSSQGFQFTDISNKYSSDKQKYTRHRRVVSQMNSSQNIIKVNLFNNK